MAPNTPMYETEEDKEFNGNHLVPKKNLKIILMLDKLVFMNYILDYQVCLFEKKY